MASTPASDRASGWLDRHFPAGTDGRPVDLSAAQAVVDIAPSGTASPCETRIRGEGWDSQAWEEFDSRPA